MFKMTAFVVALSIVLLILPLRIAEAEPCGTGGSGLGQKPGGACSSRCTKDEKEMRERCQNEDADSLLRDAKENRRTG